MNARSLLLLPAAAYACMSFAQAAPSIRITDEQSRRAGVVFEKVQPAGQTGDTLRLAGNVVFASKSLEAVSTPAAGVVQSVLISPMQTVAAGTALMKLHSPQYLEWQRDYVQSSAQRKLAADKLERDEALYKEGIIARSRLEDTRSAQLTSQVAMQEREQLLKLAGMSERALRRLSASRELNPEMILYARSAGTVIEQLVTAGQRLDAGAPVLKLARGTELVLELQASRADADRLQAGATVKVASCPTPGRVTAVSPQINAANQSVTVRAAVPGAEKCLRANQYVEAVVTAATTASSAPAAKSDASASSAASVATHHDWRVTPSAIIRHENRDYVLVRARDGVRPVPVTVSDRGGASVVVRGPLTAGNEVASQGTATLKGIWIGLGAENGVKQ